MMALWRRQSVGRTVVTAASSALARFDGYEGGVDSRPKRPDQREEAPFGAFFSYRGYGVVHGVAVMGATGLEPVTPSLSRLVVSPRKSPPAVGSTRIEPTSALLPTPSSTRDSPPLRSRIVPQLRLSRRLNADGSELRRLTPHAASVAERAHLARWFAWRGRHTRTTPRNNRRCSAPASSDPNKRGG